MDAFHDEDGDLYEQTSFTRNEKEFKQYIRLINLCLPCMQASKAILDTDITWSSWKSKAICAGLTFRVLQCVLPQDGSRVFVLQILALAVASSYQNKKHGSKLVNQLRHTFSLFCARSHAVGLCHVQADNSAVGFWLEQHFERSTQANDITLALHSFNTVATPLYEGVTSMIWKLTPV